MVLTLVAGRAAGLLHPPAIPSTRAQPTWFNGPGMQRASSHVPALPSSFAGATLATTGHRRCESAGVCGKNSRTSGVLLRRSATQQSRLLVHHRGGHAAASEAAQSKSVRLLSTKLAMSAGQQQRRGGGGGSPAGGYPPPEHLHGVFAVYKPKGFSSANVVQKIKVLAGRPGRGRGGLTATKMWDQQPDMWTLDACIIHSFLIAAACRPSYVVEELVSAAALSDMRILFGRGF